MMTPSIVHHRQASLIHQQRQTVLDAAYQAHPDRFVRQRPAPLPLPKEVWINKPPNSGQKAH
jgi:putative transposase